jgi:hypothetical protein
MIPVHSTMQGGLQKPFIVLKYIFRNEFELNIPEKDGLPDICKFIVIIYIEA